MTGSESLKDFIVYKKKLASAGFFLINTSSSAHLLSPLICEQLTVIHCLHCSPLYNFDAELFD